jgi:hypothetical protein
VEKLSIEFASLELERIDCTEDGDRLRSFLKSRVQMGYGERVAASKP